MSFPAFAALSSLQVFTIPALAGAPGVGNALRTAFGWRPSEWNGPAQCSITAPLELPGSSPKGPVSDDPLSALYVPGAPAYTTQTLYVFDAVFQGEHVNELRRTEHPIQPSASSPATSITDHAFRVPARISLEIGISDAMADYTPGMWTGNASKSVSAYQVLMNLQKNRTLITLTTRLATYRNMLVESVRAIENSGTRYALRATVSFSEVFLATVTAVGSGSGLVSTDDQGTTQQPSRPQLTGQTPSGSTQAVTPSASLYSQHNVASAAYTAKSLLASIPGAGVWSGTAIGAGTALLGTVVR
jgi:hypothetical protein